MAIDSENKRRSALSVGFYPSRVFLLPDGGLDAPDDMYVLLGYYLLGWPEPTPAPPTDDQIANALAGVYGPVSFRLLALRYSRGYAFLGDISSAMLRAEITLDNRAQVYRTAQFWMLPDNLPVGFDRDNDMIQLRLVLREPVTQQDVEYRLGMFELDEPMEEYDASGVQWRVQGADVGSRLTLQNIGEQYIVNVGDNYVTHIEALLDAAGLQHEIPPTTLVSPVAFTVPWNTYYATLVSWLCEGINYHFPWADDNGVMRTRERIDPAAEQIAVHYSTETPPRMIEEPWEKRQQFPTAWYNRAVLVIEDPSRAPVAVEAINVDATNPLSSILRARKTKSDFGADMIADTPTMIAAASYYVRDMAAQARLGTLRTFLDPRRGPRETYQLTIEDVEVGTVWAVAGWRMTFNDAQMTDVGAWGMQHDLELVEEVTITTAEIEPEFTP